MPSIRCEVSSSSPLCFNSPRASAMPPAESSSLLLGPARRGNPGRQVPAAAPPRGLRVDHPLAFLAGSWRTGRPSVLGQTAGDHSEIALQGRESAGRPMPLPDGQPIETVEQRRDIPGPASTTRHNRSQPQGLRSGGRSAGSVQWPHP